MKKPIATILAMVLLLTLLAGCAGEDTTPLSDVYTDPTMLEVVDLEDEAVALAAAPAIYDLLLPSHPGVKVEKNKRAELDYSNAADGYVMVYFHAQTTKRLKVKIQGPTTEGGYQYNLTQGEWTTFPLSDGNGSYSIKVYEETSGNKYAAVLSKTVSVTMTDEFAPFIRPNQYVDYANATNTLEKAKELTAGETDPLKKVEKVYNFVVRNLTYDTALAQSVQSGYLPDLDKVLAAQKGICFDYAALMTAMLRSQDVPCKLVVGYVGSKNPAYHAWISVWTKDQGWVDGAIFFDGSAWQRMDPTFASSGKGSQAIMQYIGDGSNYSERYLY